MFNNLFSFFISFILLFSILIFIFFIPVFASNDIPILDTSNKIEDNTNYDIYNSSFVWPTPRIY